MEEFKKSIDLLVSPNAPVSVQVQRVPALAKILEKEASKMQTD